MTKLLQLDPPIPMTCPKGEGFAHFLINDGQEHDLFWIIIVTETGEIWTFANRHVRACKNITLGRTKPLSLSADQIKQIGDLVKNGATSSTAGNTQCADKTI